MCIRDSTTRPLKKTPAAPFTTSTLQQEAARKLGFTCLLYTSYELRDPKSIDLLRAFLDEYPDTPHANRIYACLLYTASSLFNKSMGN